MTAEHSTKWLDRVTPDTRKEDVLGYHGTSIHALAHAVKTGLWPTGLHTPGVLHFVPAERPGDAFTEAARYAEINAIRFAILDRFRRLGFTPTRQFLRGFWGLSATFLSSGAIPKELIDPLNTEMRKAITKEDDQIEIDALLLGEQCKANRKGLVLSLRRPTGEDPNVQIEPLNITGTVQYANTGGFHPMHVEDIVPMGHYEEGLLLRNRTLNNVHVFDGNWVVPTQRQKRS